MNHKLNEKVNIGSDLSFDLFFDNDNNLLHRPWIGKDFVQTKSRLYVLGESHYKWGSSETIEEAVNDKDFTRSIILNHALFHLSDWNKKGKVGRIFRNVERCITGKLSIETKTREKIWEQVAYSNLVSQPMLSINHRPNHQDYYEGWKSHFSIFEQTRPKMVLVLGLEWRKMKAFFKVLENYNHSPLIYEPKIGRTHPKHCEINLTEEYMTSVLFIQHPSSYFSWEKWAKFYANRSSVTLKL